MIRNLHIVVLALILFSYPVVTVWLTIAGIEASGYNLVLKGTIVALSLLGLTIYRPAPEFGMAAMAPLLIFFVLFGLRLIYDVAVLGIIDNFQSPLYVFGYFFGLTLLPAMLLAMRLLPEDLPVLHRTIAIALVVANISLTVFSTTQNLTLDTAFAGRVEQAGLEAGTAVISPILVGLMGAMIAAYGMGRVVSDHGLSALGQAFHGALLLMGGANILLSGSRGPALAFAAVFLLVFLTLVMSSFRKIGLRSRPVGWVYLAMALIGLVLLLGFTSQSIFLFDRFAFMYDGSSNSGVEERNFIYSQAWRDFLSSPIIGKSYIVSVGGYAAHNFVLEALMATGVVGGMLFFQAVFRALVGLGHLYMGAAGTRGYVLALITVCLLVVGSTSGSVRESPELWAMAAVMTIFGAQAKRSASEVMALRARDA